jgi:hypothetical protein
MDRQSALFIRLLGPRVGLPVVTSQHLVTSARLVTAREHFAKVTMPAEAVQTKRIARAFSVSRLVDGHAVGVHEEHWTHPWRRVG